MKLGLIGNGAIARYVMGALEDTGHEIGSLLLRPERVAELAAEGSSIPSMVSSVSAIPSDLDLIVECAGHQALRQYGAEILRRGLNLVTVSIGALADRDLEDELTRAAQDGGARLLLASGAIGALDALRSAKVGDLARVRYVGRKPPHGWLGSPAESHLDLNNIGPEAQTHYAGSARRAALEYPKNANVSAAVALAGLGFDQTEVELIADPSISENIHEIHAEGEFGAFSFRISGRALSDNPRSSALAAMSVVSRVAQEAQPIRF
ncbi:aspartate dehydrogenase [Primorskyibacter sp. S87]|uniref:aspartate dehydrogenase n=1 Tax=Primorskyibacter sp. S87 TaxID=3415126 RepID=UPI003C7D0764